MSDKPSTQPARGTRDFLPDEIRRRQFVMGVIRDVYERYGFEPLETPAFENIETLLGKYGEEGNKLIFKILKRGEHEASGEADLALRYDLTVPLARVVAQYQNELPRLFKRYQIQPVWRADRPARGRFREFYQCDLDSIGSTSPVVEAEQICAVCDVLKELGFQDFVVRINHRQVLSSWLDNQLVPADLQPTVLVEIDKLDKVGIEGALTALENRGVSLAVRNRLRNSLGAEDRPGWIEWHKLNFHLLNDLGRAGFETLQTVRDLCAGSSAAEKLRFVPSLARGLSYYTGAIMEIAVEGIGSLGGGGRYDNLVGMFLGRDVPACGFSLGLERIIVVMTERGMFPSSVAQGAVDVVVTFMDDDSRGDALGLATELRQRRLRVDVFPEASRKFDKTLKYASGRGAKAMAIFGENERARGEVSVRDLQARQQEAVPRDVASRLIARLVNEPRTNPEPRTDPEP